MGTSKIGKTQIRKESKESLSRHNCKPYDQKRRKGRKSKGS